MGGAFGSGAGIGGRAGTAGFAGGGGFLGTGGTCFEQGCGPTGTPCCYEATGCGASGLYSYVCTCNGSFWSCSAPGDDGTCPPGACPLGIPCCRGRCVDFNNDPYNCGYCGNVCPGRFCFQGACSAPPCYYEDAGAPFDGGGTCCGAQYCGAGVACCSMTRSGFQEVGCFGSFPGEPTCPLLCPTCR